MEPQESLGVFSETLDRRFQNFAEGEQAKLVEAMRWEDKVLAQYMEKNRLAQWVRSTYETAQAEVAAAEQAARARAGGPDTDGQERMPLFGRRRSFSAASHAGAPPGRA